jgi:hypothetical protein
MNGREPISLVMAIPNHPWTKATKDAAAVRIAMTVAEKGRLVGLLRITTTELGLETDNPQIEFQDQIGKINPSLSIGVDVAAAIKLRATDGICHDGVKLHGKGFRVRAEEAEHLGLGREEDLTKIIRPYLNGRDINQKPRGLFVIDLFGLGEAEVRKRYSKIYQYLLEKVKPERDTNSRPSRRDNWWLFGENQPKMRGAILGLGRYVGTTDTSRHRIFSFIDETVLCDDKVVICATSDAYDLGVLSSKVHCTWANKSGVRLGVGDDPVYASNRCFDPFSFPDASDKVKAEIRAVADDLDAFRKQRQQEHADLTLTQMYNVLEKLRANEPLDADEEAIKKKGLILILKELHEKLDRLVFQAYGWPETLLDEEILARLVALNHERAEEERRGIVRWLRPDYQIPRFAKDTEKRAAKGEQLEVALEVAEPSARKPSFPSEAVAQTAAVFAALAAANGPLDAGAIADGFRKSTNLERNVASVLASLARLGHVSTPDGKTFSVRRAA